MGSRVTQSPERRLAAVLDFSKRDTPAFPFLVTPGLLTRGVFGSGPFLLMGNRAESTSGERNTRWSRKRCLMLFAAAVLVVGPGNKAWPQERHLDVTQFTIEDLVKIEISSVSRRPEELFNAPAAIYVITSEDIRRSGARFIAEALRMAPGLDVARIDASKWAISARGFNDRFANKLLVLVDGRSVYTPAFSGVYWDVQDLLLEDIDRIEVVRGPGATLWGANAVNGVINIITKSSKDTRGLYVEGGGGNVDQGFEGVRYGGKIGQNAYVRVYEKYFSHASFFDPSGNAADDWRMARGGFRVDWDASESNLLTVQGDVYRGEEGSKQILPALNPPYAQTIQ